MTKRQILSGGTTGFGPYAYLGAAISLVFCFWKATFGLVAPLIGLTVFDINPHLQAVSMWLFAAVSVAALAADRKRHGEIRPLLVAITALIVIMGTLYIFYHDAILAAGYVLLLVAAFLNQNRLLATLNRKVQAQASELTELNRSLEGRVSDQVAEIERLARLKRFVAPQLADMIVSSGDDTLLESHRREITVVFADLRGFTSFSESAEPERIMSILRDYHATTGALIHAFEATLERFAGDGIMVFFNDPLPCPDPAARAVRLAVAMREKVAELTEMWRTQGDDLDFGIGIAMGYATLGRIGFESRVDYAAIGPVTNLASRLCDEAKGDQILVSQRVQAATDDLARFDFVGDIAFKGLREPVPVYDALGLNQESGPA